MRFFLFFSIAAGLCAQPAFEVASVKPADPAHRSLSVDKLPGGRFAATNASLRILLEEAYGMRDFQIEGAPKWFDSERYDVSARSGKAASSEEMTEMLETLLADRFRLKMHQEEREFGVYVLTIGKNGAKLKEARHVDNDGQSSIGVKIRGMGHLSGAKASIEQLAEALSDVRLNGRSMLDRPVLDQTGLNGVYDFTLDFAPGMDPEIAGPSIFTAVQEQLGLKLETRNAPVKVYVIDHVEKPSEN